MTELRAKMNTHIIDLWEVLSYLRYKTGKNELDRAKFLKFLSFIQPNISKRIRLHLQFNRFRQK